MSDFYNKYPYTDFHELNLDWIIERVKQLTEDWLETKQAWENTEADWQELYNYVHDYFDNLDVQEEINNKINAMIADGTFVTITTPVIEAKVASMMPGTVASQIGDTVASQIGATVASQIGATVASQIDDAVVSPVNTWLAANITQPTTPVVDTSLTISGAAADAAVTGTHITKLENNVTDLQDIVLFKIELDTLGQVKPFILHSGDTVTINAKDGSTMTVGQIRFYRPDGTFDYWALSGNVTRVLSITEDFVSAFLWDGTAQDIVLYKTGSFLDYSSSIDDLTDDVSTLELENEFYNNDISQLNNVVFNEVDTPIMTTQLPDSYINDAGKIMSGGSALYILYFEVNKFDKIHITAEDYRLLGDYGAIAFYESIPAVNLTGELLVLGSATATDINYTYLCQKDGYIGIARGQQDDVPDSYLVTKIPKSGNTKNIKIQVFGDSISDTTWGDNHTWVSDITAHMPNYNVTVVNSAVGGSFLKSNNDVGVEDLVTNGHTLQTDSDVIVIFAGTNDWASGSTYIGSISNQTAGFYKAVRHIIEYINQHSLATILICTPIQRYNAADAERPTNANSEPLSGTGADEHTLEECSEAIKDMAHFLGTDVLDLYHISGFNRVDIMNYTTDGLHPNSLGDSKLSMLICSEIRRIFN